jgi:hypothetical protein
VSDAAEKSVCKLTLNESLLVFEVIIETENDLLQSDET